jgi:hypothetical protein
MKKNTQEIKTTAKTNTPKTKVLKVRPGGLEARSSSFFSAKFRTDALGTQNCVPNELK